MSQPDYPPMPVPRPTPNPTPAGPSGLHFWSVLVGLALTGGFTVGAVLAFGWLI
jgi:hypothetical protein